MMMKDQKMVNDKIYIIDTSVLAYLFKGLNEFSFLPGVTEWEKQAIKVTRQLFATKNIIIPMSALVELMGMLFHKTIDCKDVGTLDNYDQWFRARKAAFDQLLLHRIFNTGNVSLAYGSPEAGRIAMTLGTAPIPVNVKDQLKKRFEDLKIKLSPDQWKKRNGIPKLFDGMDAMIIGEAIRAVCQQPEKEYSLVCNDQWLRDGFNHAKKLSGYEKKLDRFRFQDIPRIAVDVGIKWNWDKKST